MKNRYVIVFMVSIMMILATGCKTTTDTQTEKVFIGGSNGLEATFEPFGIQEGSTYTIFDTDTFPVQMVLKNLGEEDIEAGDAKLSLKGISLGDFDGISNADKTNNDKIEKVSEFNPQGGEVRIDFTSGSGGKYKRDVLGFTSIDILGVVDYEYKTRIIVPKVCFKEDPRDTRVCDIEGTKEFYVSGAPISVTSVREDAAGRGKMAVTFEVNNAGSGRVTLPKTELDTRYDQIAYEIDEPDKWECKAAGMENSARLTSGKSTIRCVMKNPLQANELYIRQLGLTLKYRYQDLVLQTLKIKESQK